MISAIGKETVVERHPAVHAVELDGEAVLLDEDQGRVHLLNATANLVWGRLDGVTPLGVLSDGLAREFGSESTQILTDVVAVVDRFVDEGTARIRD